MNRFKEITHTCIAAMAREGRVEGVNNFNSRSLISSSTAWGNDPVPTRLNIHHRIASGESGLFPIAKGFRNNNSP